MITDIRMGEDDKLYGKLFGIDIYGTDYNDLKIAGKEAMEIFFIACELHGRGIKEELISMID